MNHNLHKLLKYTAIVCLCAVFGSCSLILKPIVGVRSPKSASDKKIKKYTRKWDVPVSSSFKVDTAKCFKVIPILKDTDPKLLKDLLQPLQVRGYNEAGEMQLFLINCNIGGFPNLDWNRLGTFSAYPPEMSSFKPVDTSYAFSDDLAHYTTLDNQPLDRSKYDTGDFTLIVYWAIFMGRQSKILINQINAYKGQFPDKKLNLIFINTDNLYE